MYTVLKLAALSAALAAAAVTLLDGPRNQPSPAKFLTNRLSTEIVPARAPVSMTGGMVVRPVTGCTETAWPYRDACVSGAAAAKPVRIISPDRRELARVAADSAHAQIAQR